MKIAIFGGSFDPPHKGHVKVVETALEQLDIEKLVIVPTYLNPFKSAFHTPAAQRLGWLQKLFSGNEKIEVSDFEVSQNRPVPTIETVHHFAQSSPNPYLIIGADNLASLHKWYRFEELDAQVTWVVATREGITVPPEYLTLEVDVDVSSTQLRERPDTEDLPPKIADDIMNYYKETNGTTH